MAIESEEKVARSRNIGVTWIILIFSFGFLLGLVARPALMQMGLMGELTGEDGLFDPERVYFVSSEAFFLPVFTGLLLTGVVAAIMSTADSQLLLGSAIAAGTATVSIWQFNSGGPWAMFDMAIAAAPGFMAAAIAASVVTLLTAPPSAEVTERFDRVNPGPPPHGRLGRHPILGSQALGL